MIFFLFQDKSICSALRPSNQQCSFRLGNQVYNLIQLYNKNGKYIIKDPEENVEYLLNICGPVSDDDVHCNDDNLAFLKLSAEPDIKKRYISQYISFSKCYFNFYFIYITFNYLNSF